jgi:hypothetical protein
MTAATASAAQTDDARAAAFASRWSGVTASELSTAQSFVRELCELLDLPAPHPTPEQDYMFERPVTFRHGDGSTSPGRIDCYRRGCFVLEAKKLRAASDTRRFDDAMLRARAQAENYARALEPAELAAGGRPPFLLVVDVGQVIEVYAEFTRSGATYTPFPDPRSHRIRLADLARAEVRDTLRRIWLDPLSLDPARASARVTREVAARLAELARSLEASGHAPQQVAAYLTRCLFSMFAEDVGLLPASGEQGGFVALLERHRDDPATLQRMLAALWADMDRGGFSVALAHTVLRFNGKLFKGAGDDAYSLPLTRAQVDLLLAAARANWREVEPAIFGTLLERALDPAERHALGAHYTPRAYVERLVLPAVIAPLRAEWSDVQAAALMRAQEAAELEGRARDAKMDEARAELRRFHHRLCTLRVLDPACGSGNFLYVTLEHLKRLEGEVLNQLAELGQTQDSLALEGETVTPQQLLGIEVNAHAAALAELVLWIGYLQWHIRTRGNRAVSEPVVHDYGNIQCRDAVLAWAAQRPARDANGQLRTRWDGRTYTPHPTTGEPVPDPAAQVPQWEYLQPRRAEWPQAEVIIGNPPFIGAAAMRAALGDGYVDALRRVWSDVPESADFVMYWWHAAARQVAAGRARRFGFITTNSLRQTFNRRVVQAALDAGLYLQYAIPDHPWVDSASGAAVRIAMTVAAAGQGEGRLATVVAETPGEHGEMRVDVTERIGQIHADLTVGPNLLAARALRANLGLSNRGFELGGTGFIVTPEQAAELLATATPAAAGEREVIRPYRNGRDLTDTPRGVMVIDLFGLTAEQVRSRYPAVYQWLLDRVKPERDVNRDASVRENWWLHRRLREDLRSSLAGLPRYIATVETAKHRTFQFLDAAILPDNRLVAIASDDAFHLGVLTSSVHVAWALAQGGTLEDRPVYNKTRCFETFPFPDADTGLTPELRQRIAALAEEIDAHRKRVLAQHPDTLTLTALYNVLAALRAGRALSAKERTVHAHGLVAVLRELHDELDAAVLAAYGWADLAPRPDPAAAPDEPPQAAAARTELLSRLLALNHARAAEEAAGTVRWLRPALQNPQAAVAPPAQTPLGIDQPAAPQPVASRQAPPAQAWPATLPEQMRAVADLLAASAQPLSEDAIAAHFKGRGAWKKSLPRILDALAALGRARREAAGWRG